MASLWVPPRPPRPPCDLRSSSGPFLGGRAPFQASEGSGSGRPWGQGCGPRVRGLGPRGECLGGGRREEAPGWRGFGDGGRGRWVNRVGEAWVLPEQSCCHTSPVAAHPSGEPGGKPGGCRSRVSRARLSATSLDLGTFLLPAELWLHPHGSSPHCGEREQVRGPCWPPSLELLACPPPGRGSGCPAAP